PNDETRKKPETRNPNQAPVARYFLPSGFGPGISFVPRHSGFGFDSSFGFCHSSFISERLQRLNLRRAAGGSRRQKECDTHRPAEMQAVRAAGLFEARVGQRNCIEAGLL